MAEIQPKPVSTGLKKVDMPRRPALPDGFWSLPGGAAGLQGTQEGVNKVIDELSDVYAHWKTALKEAIAGEVTRTGGNFVEIHAHAQRAADDMHVAIHIRVTKKAI